MENNIEEFQLRVRTDVHLARKVWHATTVLMMALIYVKVDRKTALALLSGAMIFFVSMDFLRLRFQSLNKIVILLFHRIMRKSEVEALAGTTYLLLGVFFLVFLYPKEIVTLTLLFLALGDPIASYFGIRYGRDTLTRNKSLQGTLAAFFCCTLLACFFYTAQKLMLERILLVSLISGFVGAAAEAIPIGKLDDHLTFPLICSFLLWIIFQVFM